MPASKIHIRSVLKPGDLGTIIHLHGVLYSKEYGWDCTFEGYAASSLAKFAIHHDPKRERIWVAESNRQIIGCVGIVKQSKKEAQLRWFLVHPSCRRKGLGKKLLNKAIKFCRACNYKSVFLWTTSDLKSAASIYSSVGFRKTKQKTHLVWGKKVTEQRCDLSLVTYSKSLGSK